MAIARRRAIKMSKVRVGVAGVGALGMMHARHINAIQDAELVAVCDGMPELVEKSKTEFDVPFGYAGFEEMAASGKIDGVVLATPIATHKEQIKVAVEQKLHIFCEKPVGKTTEECYEIQDILASHDKIFTVGFMRRYDPSYAEAMKKYAKVLSGNLSFSGDTAWIHMM